jgi:hypothetical protein
MEFIYVSYTFYTYSLKVALHNIFGILALWLWPVLGQVWSFLVWYHTSAQKTLGFSLGMLNLCITFCVNFPKTV